MPQLLQVELWEDKIQRSGDDRLIRHSGNSQYAALAKRGLTDGQFTFAGRNWEESPLLDNVSVCYVMFHSAMDDDSGRAAWADPLRLSILKRLADEHRWWYLSIMGWVHPENSTQSVPIEVDIARERSVHADLATASVRSDKPPHYGPGQISRTYIEVPTSVLSVIFQRYWPAAVHGYSIEGINMPPGQIDRITEWNDRPRSAELLHDVLSASSVVFYTFPAEPTHLVFLSNTLSCSNLRQLLDIDNLQVVADEIAVRIQNERRD